MDKLGGAKYCDAGGQQDQDRSRGHVAERTESVLRADERDGSSSAPGGDGGGDSTLQQQRRTEDRHALGAACGGEVGAAARISRAQEHGSRKNIDLQKEPSRRTDATHKKGQRAFASR